MGRIENKDWDWFGFKKDKYTRLKPVDHRLLIESDLLRPIEGDPLNYETTGHHAYEEFSLADLLANKSWCKAVWGEHAWESTSRAAFRLLQREGQQKALDYITKPL